MSINGIGSYHTGDYAIQNRNRSARGKSAIADFMGNVQSSSESSDSANNTGITSVDDKNSFTNSNMDYQRIISERRNEIYEKLKNGDTEESFQIGGSSFTEKEWDKLLSEVDDITEEMREAMREEHEKRFAEVVEEKSVKQTEHMDGTDVLSKLFDTENTDIIELADNTSKEISARVYSAEELQEAIDKEVQSNQYKKKSLYEMLMDSCPEGTNATFRFAGESKIYSFYEYIEEFERRSGEMSTDAASTISHASGNEIDISNFKEYETPNYKFVPEPEIGEGGMRIYKNGQSVAVFSVDDLKIRVDEQTGTRVLISEIGGYGGAWYDAIPVGEELENGLAQAIGVDEIPEATLEGYYIGTHARTGIQYVMKPGDEGRGGKVLLRNEVDVAKYNALAEEYYNRYPNLVTSQEFGRIYASFEICGMMERTETGFVRIGYDNISYNDNFDYKKNWSAMLTGDTWEMLWKWLEENRSRMEKTGEFSTWGNIIDELGGSYERVWSDEELKQGYLNN